MYIPFATRNVLMPIVGKTAIGNVSLSGRSIGAQAIQCIRNEPKAELNASCAKKPRVKPSTVKINHVL
jgi:hypothetical protein